MPPPDSRPGQFKPTSDQFLAKQQVVKDPAAASDANATGNVMMEDESMGEQTQNKGTSNPFSFGKGGKQ